jgi:hypothetical protein
MRVLCSDHRHHFLLRGWRSGSSGVMSLASFIVDESAALSWTTAVGGTTIGLVGAKIRTPGVYFCTMAWSCRSSFFGSPSSSSFPLYSQCKCLDLFPDKSTHMFRISIHSWGIDISVIYERIIEHTFPVFRFITFTDPFPLPVGR